MTDKIKQIQFLHMSEKSAHLQLGLRVVNVDNRDKEERYLVYYDGLWENKVIRHVSQGSITDTPIRGLVKY